MSLENLTIIGGGLAGSEAAWQAAQRGIQVNLFEMRPLKSTGAHLTGLLAELICSNSLGSNQPDRASGVLKQELQVMNSLVLSCAESAALPAGGALAVDRDQFASLITEKITNHPNINLIRKECTEIPSGPTIIASGPLTSEELSKTISILTGQEHLFFFDAIAPIVSLDSVDLSVAFRASRYEFADEPETGDYINCPFDEAQYDLFVHELANAQRIQLESIEGLPTEEKRAGHKLFFEGCLPIEILADRSPQTLSFGPMRPVGLRDPHTGRRPHAVLQLRQDNLNNTLYNLVGFQTNLTFSEQKRVFHLIPGLEKAEFVRYGQMHRNTFIFSPALLHETLQFKNRPDLFFAGQIVGVEGYMGNVATGLVAGINAANLINGAPVITLPQETMTGALIYYITHASPADFQPMKANFGILPRLTQRIVSKKERGLAYGKRAIDAMQTVNCGDDENEK
ncbi:MAG: methylenetetrahydrofolate--tRNA-(uracil(54)-C(5))-methyltransferase (FADH(2)-oxidizing) TrmFO [Anaerolineaceae bacterium]